MFYIETDKGINNIITNMYLDENEGKISSIRLFNIPKDKILEYSDFISCITKTTNPLCLNSAQIQKEYFDNVTMKELVSINSQIDGYSSDTLKKNLRLDFDRIMKRYPKILSTESKIRMPEVYINNRDSILYLSDLDYLDKDLELTFKSNLFSIEQLSKLYSLSVRMILPKYLIDKIDCKHKKVFVHRSDSKKLVFSTTKTTSNYIGDDIDEFLNYVQTHNERHSHKLYDIIPGVTLHKVYLNATFKEWSDIINNLSHLEDEYVGQILGAVYYNLINFKNIEKLFSILPEVKSDIVKRIYDRKGN